LLIPVLASVIIYILAARAIVGISQESLTYSSAPESFITNPAFPDLLYLIFTWAFVGFLVSLGLIEMSHNILKTGKCGLKDWIKGIRQYFWRILNVSLVIYLGFAILTAVPSLLLNRFPYLIEGSVTGLIHSAVTLALYTCYAAILFDDANLQSSITLGLETIRSAGRTFLSFVIIYFAIYDVRLFFLQQDVWTAISARTVDHSLLPALTSIMTPQNLAYNTVSSFLTPLWFLIMFTLYRKYSRKPSQLKKFCTECGNKLAPNSTLCDKCGNQN